jgi:hypothetical protein
MDNMTEPAISESIEEEPSQHIEEEPSQEYEEIQEETQEEPFQEVRRRGRPRMTPEQKKEAKAARARLKVVEAPKKEPKPKIIERVVREYVEVPVTPAPSPTSPFEAIGNVLRNRAVSDYERKKQQWASFQLI